MSQGFIARISGRKVLGLLPNPATETDYIGRTYDKHISKRGAVDEEDAQRLELAIWYYECPQCRRIHLHAAGGVCTDCLTTLGPPQALTPAQLVSDYYRYLATHTEEVFRLNCEELTGQTNKADGRRRQRLFQDIVLPGKENERTDPIDLLSVTTTMEVGVDIGGCLP